MRRLEIIEHYKSYFGTEDMPLSETDNLMIAWAESLLSDVLNAKNDLIITGFNLDDIKRVTEIIDICEKEDKRVIVIGNKQKYAENIPEVRELVIEPLPKLIEPFIPNEKRTNHERQPSRFGKNNRRR